MPNRQPDTIYSATRSINFRFKNYYQQKSAFMLSQASRCDAVNHSHVTGKWQLAHGRIDIAQAMQCVPRNPPIIMTRLRYQGLRFESGA